MSLFYDFYQLLLVFVEGTILSCEIPEPFLELAQSLVMLGMNLKDPQRSFLETVDEVEEDACNLGGDWSFGD